jgi:DMSO/TMAO reductase YedYZ heme-binding membrane subunit
VGVGFAVSHFMHLGALVALGLSFPEPFVGELDALTLVRGGIAYLFITAMVLTSSDRAQEWLGGARWRWLHWRGSYYVWIVFFQSYLPRAWSDPVYVPISVALVAAIVLRGVARKRPLVDH